jgi:transcription initiation factor TFIIIB Brf1 subunit/transcription initiation factor TFIIB
MKGPYVCAVCGGTIQIGRHKSGWRHIDDARSDHRVRRMGRAEYEELQRRGESQISDSGAKDGEA